MMPCRVVTHSFKRLGFIPIIVFKKMKAKVARVRILTLDYMNGCERINLRAFPVSL